MGTVSAFSEASAALTLTSLILAPLGLGTIVLLYMTNRPRCTTVATCLGLLNAILVVVAASLWIVASLIYAADVQIGVLGRDEMLQGVGAAVRVEPSVLILFAVAAFTKIIVLPVMTFICLIVLLICITISVFGAVVGAVLLGMALACVLACCCCAGDDKTIKVKATGNPQTQLVRVCNDPDCWDCVMYR